MFKKKYKLFNNSPNKSNLDQVLWFIENYLPQKKDRGVQKKMYIASLLSKTLWPSAKNMSISFTFGNWALPYLKLLKKIGEAK